MRVRNFTTIIAALVILALVPSSAFAGQKAKVRFAATNSAVAENAGTAQVAVTRLARSGKAKSAINTTITVGYATSNGTAVAGKDYVSTSGRLTFKACTTGAPAADDPCLRQVITVPVLDDNLVNGNRTVRLALTSPSRNAVVVNPQKTTLTIADNEGPTRVSFDQPSYSVWEIGPQAEIHVFRSGSGITGTSTVDFATSNGSATSPGDYTAQTTTLTFAPGEVDKTVFVDITDDSVVEPTETFNIGLSNPSTGLAVDTPSEQVTILDDDAPTPAHLAIDATPNPVGEGGDVTFTVTRTGSVDGPASVDYATVAGTAAADVDFAAVADTLDFDPGDTSQSFTVSTLGDSLHEGDETFGVTLGNALPAGTVIDAATANVTIADGDPVPTISAGSGSVSGGTVTYVIQLTNPTTTDITVTYVIVDGSGNTVGTGTATIPAGETSTAVQAPATGSGPYTITISNPTGGTIDPSNASSTAQQGSGSTQQQDPTVTVTPDTGSNGSGSGSSPEGSSTTFDVIISQPTDHPVTVDYEIHDGSGNTIGTGTVTIPGGETSVIVTAPVPAGTEGPVTVVIKNPAGATLAADGGSSASVPVTTATTAAAAASGSAAQPKTSTDAILLLGARLSPCKLTVKQATRLDGKHGLLTLTLRSGRACTVTAGASVKNARKRDTMATRVLRALKAQRKTISLKANRTATLKLHFTKRGMRFIKRAVAAKRPLTLTVAVIERDLNKRVGKRTVRTRLKLR